MGIATNEAATPTMSNPELLLPLMLLSLFICQSAKESFAPDIFQKKIVRLKNFFLSWSFFSISSLRLSLRFSKLWSKSFCWRSGWERIREKRERGKKYRENRQRKRQEERNEEGMTERLYKVREEWKMCSWEIERKIFSWKDWRRKKWERVWEREKGKIKFNRVSLNSIFEVFLLTVKLNTGVIPSKLIQFNFNWF